VKNTPRSDPVPQVERSDKEPNASVLHVQSPTPSLVPEPPSQSSPMTILDPVSKGEVALTKPTTSLDSQTLLREEERLRKEADEQARREREEMARREAEERILRERKMKEYAAEAKKREEQEKLAALAEQLRKEREEFYRVAALQRQREEAEKQRLERSAAAKNQPPTTYTTPWQKSTPQHLEKPRRLSGTIRY